MIKDDVFLEKIGIQLLSANIFLFVCIFVLFMIGGFTSDELTEVLKILAPIKAMYITAIIKYIIDNKKLNKSKDLEVAKLSNFYKTATRVTIYSHIIIIYSLLIFAAINIMNFQDFKTIISVVETFFGGYIGLLIADMYKTHAEEN